jgi:hypothetical protein
MIAVATFPRSSMLIRWFGSGQPVELVKVELVSPIASPRSVISRANASSDPARPSATTTQASLPDCTMMPLMSSSTVGRSSWSRNMVDPPIACALSDTRNSVSECNAPVFDRLEQHVERHDLRHRRGRERHVGVLFVEHGVVRQVVDPGGGGPRLERGECRDRCQCERERCGEKAKGGGHRLSP